MAGQQGSEPGPSQGLCCSEMGAALQQGCDSVLQGHSHFLGGLAQQWAVRVAFLEVQDMTLLTLRCAATLLTHVELGPALLVRVLLLHAMDLLEVRLQRAALGEGLVTQTALVGPHTCRQQGSASGPDRDYGACLKRLHTERSGHLTGRGTLESKESLSMNLGLCSTLQGVPSGSRRV